MAQSEHDREDILREATALVERVELWLPDQPEAIVVGFRQDGSASFFFGVEPVLQFNARCEFRRGYEDGRLLKAQQGRIVALRRAREDQQVTLYSQALSDEESAEFARSSLELLTGLRDAIRKDAARIGRQVPDEANVIGRVRQWLEDFDGKWVVANQPNVGGSSRQG